MWRLWFWMSRPVVSGVFFFLWGDCGFLESSFFFGSRRCWSWSVLAMGCVGESEDGTAGCIWVLWRAGMNAHGVATGWEHGVDGIGLAWVRPMEETAVYLFSLPFIPSPTAYTIRH